jgi:hypothetical protein
MRKRMVLAFGLVLGLGLASLVAWHLLPPRPGVTPENFHRLRLGMTEPEVEAILGEPTVRGCETDWGDEHCYVRILFRDGPPQGPYLLSEAQLETDNGRREYLPSRDPSFWDRVRPWLPWSQAEDDD